MYNDIGEIMRLKHIKNADKIVETSKYFIKDKSKNKGKWNKIFGNDNPIEIEIGMGKGKFLIEKALNNPDINYIGIDKYESVLVSTVKKLDEYELDNIKIICCDASNINEVFDREVNKLYLNFSDPWPKKRHTKRRLTSPIFLEKFELIFKDKFDLEMKTDNDDLFLYSLEVFKEKKYIIKEMSRNYQSLYKTEYEDKFIAKGKNINYVNIVK